MHKILQNINTKQTQPFYKNTDMCCFMGSCFLADRTNGHAYASVASVVVVVCLWRYVLWLNGASQSKSYYWQSIGSRIWEIDWYQNEWPWPLFRSRIKVTSTLRYIWRWISRKLLEIEAWFQRTINKKWHMGYQRSHDRWRHVTLKGQTRDPNTLRAQYLENSWI